MSGYRPRHASTDASSAAQGAEPKSGVPTPAVPTPAVPPPPSGPTSKTPRRSRGARFNAPAATSRRRSSGPLGLAAAGIAVLAVVAVLIIVSLPHSNRPIKGAASATAVAGRNTKRGSPAGSGQPSSRPSRLAPTTSSRSGAGGTGGARNPGPATKGLTGARAKAGKSSLATSATAPTTNPAASTSPADNLPVPAGFGPLLRQVWVSAHPGGAPLTPADVQSTLPGSVYYASQPAVGYYWAVSQFVPTPEAQANASTPEGKAVLAQFAYVAIFAKAPGRGWAYAGAYRPGSCSSDVPAPVYRAWGFCLSSQVGS